MEDAQNRPRILRQGMKRLRQIFEDSRGAETAAGLKARRQEVRLAMKRFERQAGSFRPPPESKNPEDHRVGPGMFAHGRALLEGELRRLEAQEPLRFEDWLRGDLDLFLDVSADEEAFLAAVREIHPDDRRLKPGS